LRNLIASLLIILLTFSVFAQQTSGQKPQSKSGDKTTTDPEASKKDKATKEAEAAEEASLLRQRGLELLRQAGDEASTISDGRTGSKLQTKAADILWDYDQDTARKYFESAFDIAARYYRDNKPSDQTTTRAGVFGNTEDARMNVIHAVSWRDSALARKFTDQYVEEKHREQQEAALQGKNNDATTRFFGNIDPAAKDLLAASMSLYPTDPKGALELAERAFATGTPSNAAMFLAQLSDSNRAAADKLYLLCLNRIVSDESSLPGQLMLLSAYPFGDNSVYVGDGSTTSSSGFPAPKNFTIDPQLINQFFSAAVTILSRTADLNVNASPDAPSRIAVAMFDVTKLRPKVAQFKPALMDTWDSLTARLTAVTPQETFDSIGRGQPPAPQQRNGPVDVPNNGDKVTELLNSADKATDPVKRDSAYQRVAVMADRGGDTDRALNIADKISDPESRAATKSWIYYEAALRAIQRNRFDEAQKYESLVDAVDQSAYLYTETASAALKAKDQARATELLEESLRRTRSAHDSRERTNALFGIANTFSSFDTLRGFEVAAEAVQAANSMRDFDIEKNYIERVLGSNGKVGIRMSSNVDRFDVGKTLEMLGHADFERSVLLAQSLSNKAVKITAIMAVAVSAIDNKKPRTSR